MLRSTFKALTIHSMKGLKLLAASHVKSPFSVRVEDQVDDRVLREAGVKEQVIDSRNGELSKTQFWTQRARLKDRSTSPFRDEFAQSFQAYLKVRRVESQLT